MQCVCGSGRPCETREQVIWLGNTYVRIKETLALFRMETSNYIDVHEQSNPCMHGIIMDLKTIMMMILEA